MKPHTLIGHGRALPTSPLLSHDHYPPCPCSRITLAIPLNIAFDVGLTFAFACDLYPSPWTPHPHPCPRLDQHAARGSSWILRAASSALQTVNRCCGCCHCVFAFHFFPSFSIFATLIRVSLFFISLLFVSSVSSTNQVYVEP